MEPGTERVLVGGVLHWGYETHREACLPFYLAHLAAQVVPEGYEICYGFVLDGAPANAELYILKALRDRVSYLRTYLWKAQYMPERRSERGRLDRFDHMAFVRNLMADLAGAMGAAYLFSVDGDILLHPSSLGVLLGMGREQAAVLIPNTPPPDEPWAFNVLDFTVDGTRCTHIEPRPQGGLCGVTGAACLYSAELLRHVRFYPDPQGEDVGFGRAARQWQPGFRAGYVACGASHLMVPEQIKPHVDTCPLCLPLLRTEPSQVIDLAAEKERRIAP